MTPGTTWQFEITPQIPPQLARLSQLANDLYYSWDRHVRGLFFYLDRELWDNCRHNPKVMLRRISQQRLDEAARDRTFLESYHRALANYDSYQSESGELQRATGDATPPPLVAYFSAEFGLHESLPIYSGGLGILAGDFCKAASDIGLPFVAVGLLYRLGNFVQTIDEQGQQHMQTLSVANEDLPISPALDPDGKPLVIAIALPDSQVQAKVWQVRAGHIDLYLLDTDLPGNRDIDRAITHAIYPSDRALRLQQEIVLGIGGVRALEQLGRRPDVWHINEGHPSLLLVERWRNCLQRGLPFAAAAEVVAASTVFTTHTPVTAGHEIYTTDLIRHYLAPCVAELGIGMDEFLAIGQSAAHGDGFNLTTFALRASGFHNGVSRIHGEVASAMESHMWPEIPVAENPMDYVTNGVHVQTFLASEWINVLDDVGWRNEVTNPEYWQHQFDRIPDATFWSVRLRMKAALTGDVRRVLTTQGRRLGRSAAQVERQLKVLENPDDTLVLGFARRFATYKRGTLLFSDLPRLERLLNDPQRPVVILFAGRAHPSDHPGQALIREIQNHAGSPALFGKIILLEGYDLALARALVSGVDVWVNTPEYPMEASGTSGMKAAMNAVVNLSVMDGWWAEAYDGSNGFAVEPHPAVRDAGERRRLEAKELLDALEYKIIPTYFNKFEGLSREWIGTARRSASSILPQFNAQRMVMDYFRKFYTKAQDRGAELSLDSYRRAIELAAWRSKVLRHWPAVSLRRLDAPQQRIGTGDELKLQVGVHSDGLAPEDITVECLFGTGQHDGDQTFPATARQILQPARIEHGMTIYEATLKPPLSGLVSYKIRAYPCHPMLCHPFELGFMKWL